MNAKIKLFLMHCRVAVDIDRAQVLLDFIQHIPLSCCATRVLLRVKTQCRLPYSLYLHSLPFRRTRLLEQLVTDGLGDLIKPAP